jgi:hypothetical protein
MDKDNLLPFSLPAICRKKVSVAFDGGLLSSDGGVLVLRDGLPRRRDLPIARQSICSSRTLIDGAMSSRRTHPATSNHDTIGTKIGAASDATQRHDPVYKTDHAHPGRAGLTNTSG